VSEPFLRALAAAAITTPTEIQAEMIPAALAGRDVTGQARTGTGKTLAYALPILQRIDPAGGVQSLCLVPTRELAAQVAAEARWLGEHARIRTAAVFGGQKPGVQLAALQRRPPFVVGTPGRVQDFLDRGVLDVGQLRFVVLDEEDRMLDIGFRDDIHRILGRVPAARQTIVVSATINDEIRRLVRQYTRDPLEVNVSRDTLTVEGVEQSYITVEKHERLPLLRRLLEHERPRLAIIFTNTRSGARRLGLQLRQAGLNVGEIHGDLVQSRRQRVLEQFRRQHIHLLVATDVAARGLHVENVSHIINYDIPEDPEVYVHRVGRTARMGGCGTAITFVGRNQGRQLTAVEMLINREIPPRSIPGFSSRPLPHEPQCSPAPVKADRAASPGPPPDGPPPTAPPATITPRRTLGSRFKPLRRTRLRR
jgi:ATP-dependent RNA helicase DeaD